MLKRLFITILLISIPVLSFAQDKASEKDSFLAAKDAFQSKNYSVSIDLFSKFIKNFPTSQATLDAKLYLGQAYFYSDRFMEARDTLAELEKSYMPTRVEDRLLFWLGQVYLKVKDYKEAAKYFKRIIDDFPQSKLILDTKLQLGYVLFEDGELKEARDVFDGLSKEKNLSVSEDALFKKGEISYLLRDYDSAIISLESFVKIFLDSDRLDKAYYYLAQSDFNLDKFDKAIEHFNKAASKSGDDVTKAMSFEGAGWAYLKQDKFSEAEKAFMKIEDFNDLSYNKENLYLGKAVLNFNLNNLDKALEYYDDFVTYYPRSEAIAQALFGKAQCLSGLLRLEDALEQYQKVINMTEGKGDEQSKDILGKSHYNLAWIYLRLGKLDAAISEFKKTIETSSDQETKMSALYEIGRCYQQAHILEEAVKAYKEMLISYPNNPYADYIKYEIGLSLLDLHKEDEAITCFKDFNKNFTSSKLLGDVNYYLAYAYFKKGDFKEAANQLDKFLLAFNKSSYRNWASYLLGVAHSRLGEQKVAINIFNALLGEKDLDQDLAKKTKYELANAFIMMGEDDIAAKKLSELVNEYQDKELSPGVMLWLGEYHYRNSQFEVSQKYLDDLIKLYPESELYEQAKYQRSLITLGKGDLDQSVLDLRKIISETEQAQIKIKTMVSLAEILLKQDKKQDAIKVYSDLVNFILSSNQLDNNKEDVTRNQSKTIGNVLSKVNLNNDNEMCMILKSTYIKLGDLYREDRDFDKVIYYYKQALSYFKEESKARTQFNIAECYEEEGSVELALKQYLSIPYTYEKDVTWVVKGLLTAARIYEDREDWGLARDTYIKVLAFDVPEKKYAQERINSIDEILKKK